MDGLRAVDEIDFKIIRDEEVEEAVAVALDEGAARSVMDAGQKQAGLFRDVGEGAVAVVAIEPVLAVVGDEEVVEAVVVVVADADAHGPSGLRRAGRPFR